MAINWQIKNKAMKARGLMDQISAEYDGLIKGAGEHLGDVQGISSVVSEMQADLTAAANIMGNSNGASTGFTAPPVAPEPPPVPLKPGS